MAEPVPSSIHEEKPKINTFLYVASGFFILLFIAMLELPITMGKLMWLVIASLNVLANGMQIYNTHRTKYVLWRRGLSIYLGNNREALVRFDRALAFKQFKGYNPARKEAREYGVASQIRSYPAFGGRRRWLVIFERDDGERQGLVFDPSPMLENMFRQHLIEADQAREQAEFEAAASAPEAGDVATGEGWEEDAQSLATGDDAAAGREEPRPPR